MAGDSSSRDPDEPDRGRAPDTPWSDDEAASDPDATASADATMTREPGAAPPPASVGDPEERYEDQGEHARGGLGRIRRVRDRKLGRTVAIKELLAPSGERVARFWREAELTARLEHPGVVPVYDAGYRDDGEPYYAMKMVSGETLRDRLEQLGDGDVAGRLAQLPLVLAIAETIAYAHSRGVIHRDLKPSNVLLGEYGEVVVVDWGLAKQLDGEIEDADASSEEGGGPTGDDLTIDGQILGTPAYMAPEQARGERVDRAADVYALGAILYHLLAGRAPYRGGSSDEVLTQVVDRPPPDIAEVADVRPALAAIVRKAMARNPAHRYRDAGAFRDDLRRYQAGQLVRAHRYTLWERLGREVWRRRGWLAAAIVVAMAGVAAYGLTRTAPGLAELCRAADDEMARVWTPEKRAQVKEAILATGAPFADSTWERVDAGLQAYTASHAAARTAACAATAELGRQSPAMFDRRIACLDERVAAAAALVEVLAEANATVVENATRAVASLPSMAPCGEPAYLLAEVPPPRDADVARRVEALEPEVRRARALFDAGRAGDALALCRRHLPDARLTGYAPIVAELQACIGAGERELGNYRTAADALTDAYYSALTGGDDATAARVAAMLIYLNATQLAEHEAALRWERDAEAAVARLPPPKHEESARLYTGLGNHAMRHGQLGEAEAHFERALEHFEHAFGPEHPDVALALANLGDAATRQARVADAVALKRRALAIIEATRGPDHPRTADVLAVLGVALQDADELDEAVAVQERVIAIREKVLGPNHPATIGARGDLGYTLAVKGEHERAVALQTRTVEGIRAVYGDDHPALVAPLSDLANTLQRMSRYDDAEAAYREALAILEAEEPQNPERMATLLNNHGVLQTNRGRYDEARATLERAVEVMTALLGPDSPRLAPTFNALGNLERYRGNYDEAARFYERDRALTEAAHGPDSLEMAATLANLAELASEQGELARARELYEQSLVIQADKLGPEHPQLGRAKLGLASIENAAGDPEAAARLYGEALAAFEKGLGPDHALVGYALLNWGMLELDREAWAEAGERLARATAVLEKALGPEHPHLGNALVGLGRARHQLGEPARAVALLRRALAIQSAAGGDPTATANTRFALARALWDSADDRAARAEARTLATEALRAVTSSRSRKRAQPAAIRDWLRTHRE